nr:uncharacterized protein LOC104089099 [Ipomoea batatas]
MESGYFAPSLLVFILNASFWIPAPASAATFTVQIESIVRNELLAACDLDGRRLPRQSIRSLKKGNFTVNLRHDEDYRSTEIETMTCDLRSGDYHGSFVMFDSLNWNVSSYCDPDSLCQWKVVPEGICLAHALNCSVLHFWPKPTA